MHWATAYIGLPWSARGEGPDSFHCWAFVRHVQSQHFGRTLPVIPNPQGILRVARRFRDHPERQRWCEVTEAREGDCVLMRQARYPIHIGVWIVAEVAGVLHCDEQSGVVFQRPDAIRLNRWHIEGVYRFQGDLS